MATTTVQADELHEAWRLLSPEERIESFGFLSPEEAQAVEVAISQPAGPGAAADQTP